MGERTHDVSVAYCATVFFQPYLQKYTGLPAPESFWQFTQQLQFDGYCWSNRQIAGINS